MKLKQIADEITDAINKQCYLPALALTLVVPDICAKYYYPEIYNKKEEYNGHRGQGAAYAKWYDECIGKYNVDPETQIGLLDGRSCWRLRCDLLHEGSIELDIAQFCGQILEVLKNCYLIEQNFVKITDRKSLNYEEI